MKYVKLLPALFAVALVFFACQKEYSIENGTGNNSSTAQWQFKEGGVQFKGPIDTAYVDTVSTIKFLTVEGKSDDGKSRITLQVFVPDLQAGTYKTPLCSFDYQSSGVVVYQSDLTAVDSFSITISKIDTSGVTGTFSGKALDKAGNSKTIVDGKFTATFKGKSVVVNPPVTDSGQVMLWSKAGCGGGTSTTAIAVSVSNKSGQISSFYPTEPTACGTAGAFTVKLPVGSYTWKAKCGTDSITGSVSVTKNGCTKVEINFIAPQLDYFPTTTNSNWSYLFENSTPDDTAYVLSTGNTKTFSTGTYNLFINDYGTNGKDSSYYRKGSGLYYEYYPANSFGLDAAPAAEHLFLKDNVSAGVSWSTSVSGTYQGIPVTAKVLDTLSQKLTSYAVGSITYQDVLEVHSGYYLVAPAPVGTQLVYLVKQWFAKGVGLIKYDEYDVTAANGYTMDLTRSKVY